MNRTILLFCCWLLVPGHYAIAANGVAQGTSAPQSASSIRAVKPLIIPAAKSLPANAKPTRSSAARTKLAPIKLNLSLPPELVKGMGFGKPVAEAHRVPVLPSMFGEAKPEPSAYQLTGKLITNERQNEASDNYFNSVEGAQLSIEFRQ
jgi:hypothetical protein